ncbi:MAG: cell division protein SepF [Coriobacteriales bacterium]|jgi:cell division inhibitor SepF|nr:cell division protein SepF [Coriobacteriales bacterium]
MGILDNVKSRLNIGGQSSRPDDGYDDSAYAEDGYDDYAYDGQYDDDGYETAYDEASAGSPRATASRSFGVARTDYQTDDHAPIISMTDVRSQNLTPRARQAAGQAAGQSTRPSSSARRSTANGYVSSQFDDDSKALNDALSRSSVNSLSQLRTERQRFDESDDSIAFNDTPSYYTSRSGQPTVRQQRGNRASSGFRQVVVVTPATYADAEQVAVALKAGNAVAIVLNNPRPELAKRILDFAFGAASALDGQVDRLADRVFAITRDFALTQEEQELLRSRGII